MAIKKYSSAIYMLQGWWHARVAAHGRVHGQGTKRYKREAIILLSILLALTVGYLTAFYFASDAVQDLVNTCASRFEIELENADITPPTIDMPRSVCTCLAHVLLDKNGIVRLALVDRGALAPLALEPVTKEDSVGCIDALWKEPDNALAKRLTP